MAPISTWCGQSRGKGREALSLAKVDVETRACENRSGYNELHYPPITLDVMDLAIK